MTAYQQLSSRFHRLHQLSHLQAMVSWDGATMMPSGGNQARANAMAELGVIIHQQMAATDLSELFKQAKKESLEPWQAANLHEMHNSWQKTNVLPEDLVREKSLAGAKCEHEWRSQRGENNWAGFAENLKPVVELTRKEAEIRAKATGCSRYDALLNVFEPGMTTEKLDKIFGQVKSWLPELIQKVQQKQKAEALIQPLIVPQGPFPVAAQESLGRDVMGLLGFDFNRGRLDISMHPFCGGVPEDVRITTRYDEADFTQSLMGIVHETGHARYEQNLPLEWISQPVARARSMGIHESQSLFFEMQLGRHPGFLELILPKIKQHLTDQSALSLENLQTLYTQVNPGNIRVDADEVTYPAHVILRYEIEKALIEGEMEVDDIPAVWNQKMQQYLGLNTEGNFKDGPMQDIHWTDGAIGYFPSYTLGAMYAAQQFSTIRKQLPNVDQMIAKGDLAPIFDWLQQNIWSQASRYDTDTLIEKATGETLNPEYFRQHLENRYL
ncbi:carboxypeptidase M32 [Pelagibaculum spongiae]|uniref:Metal-dependent carboxypeptidase n=1 Tax=Pelagibaculum spongiae TaxID=2080658 RepID=A0A2V1GX40_9GAMM|nr:carboxypeptidase M32 [Pelagibaculum spongiae]PVZ65705.1 carboxypeptidase M32 [Pelagibaculum spongiae]